MQTLSAYSITVPRTDLTLDPAKRTGQFTVDVKNEQSALDRVVLDIVAVGTGASAADPAWFLVDRHLRAIPPDGSEQFLVSVTVPEGVAAGSFQVQPVAYSSDHPPDDTKVAGPLITVTLPPPPLPTKVPWWRRWWWPWWLIAAGALVLVAVVVVVLVIVFSHRSSASPALRFDGSKVVTISGTNPLPLTTKFTLQATITPSASTNPDTAAYLLWAQRPDGGVSIYAYTFENHLYFNVCPPTNTCRTVSTLLALGQKQVVTVTYDAVTTKTLVMYIDGAQKDTIPVPHGSDTQNLGPFNLWIGRYMTSAVPGFNGDLDDVAVWNDVLPTKQISKDAQHPPTGPQSGLVALWRFDEPAGQQQVTDSSGNGHDGFLGDQQATDPADPDRVNEPG